jgi:hypothetical protein
MHAYTCHEASLKQHLISYESPYYRAEVEAEVAKLSTAGETALSAKAAEVAKVSTFIWIADTKAVESISGYLKDASQIQKKTKQAQSE